MSYNQKQTDTIGFIHSTESFGTVDGPGIRYVVFFSGCPMRCLYCHNPDTWEMRSGTKMTVDEILDGYDNVKTLIRNGGITATGGEPLLQIEFLIELFEKAKARGISTCLDTSGIMYGADSQSEETERDSVFDRLLSSTDIVMLDIKHIDNEEHKKLTGHENTGILAFLKYISEWRGEDGRKVEIWIRHVVVPGITLNDEYLERLGQEIGKYRIKALDVLPYHDMAKPKYEKLGIDYALADTPPATKEQAKHARDMIITGMRKAHAGIQP